MKARLLLAASVSSLLLAACGGSSNEGRGVPTPEPAPITGVITTCFNPGGVTPGCPTQLPSAINLAFQGTTDLTLNPPVADPGDFGDPAVAISALDGFGTVTPVATAFSRAVAPASVTAGASVRVFEVTLTGPGGAVTGVTRELTPQEFAVSVAPTDPTGRTIAIVPVQPLKPITSYMAVVTNGVTDTSGNPATPDQIYFFTQSSSPLVDGSGNSTVPALTNAQAQALEPLRQLTNAQEAAAASAGVTRSNIVLSWTFTTQSTNVVLQALRQNLVAPAPSVLAPTGFTIGDVVPGLPPIADIIVGRIDLPYYLDPAEGPQDPTPLQTFWQANPGAYVPPFDQFGLDPTSTNLTYANPIPSQKATVSAPVLVTVPNAASGQVQPADGWPVVIYQHGITRNRSDAIALAAGLAAQGYAVVSIDLPLHGITDITNPLYAEGPLVGALGAQERHFNLDLEGDGAIDGSGTYFINLGSLLTSRDNLRQGIADLFTLTASIDTMTVGGVINFDASNVSFVGQSLGGIVGSGFLSLEPNVTVGVLSVPGGGIANLLAGSASFGPVIRAGLQEAGVEPDSPQFFQFLGAAQTVIDSADPVNLARFSEGNAVLLHAVVGGGTLDDGAVSLPDQVVPNAVTGAPLAGTEPLIRAFGLTAVTEAGLFNAGGDPVRAAVRFIKGEHGSLLSPARNIPPPASANGFLDVTTEMQTQAGSFIVSGGTAIQVTDETVIRTE